MQLQKYLALCCFFICLSACKEVDPNKQIDEGNFKDQVYTSQEIGWQIRVPEGWDIITKSQNEKFSETGKKAMEETFDVEIDDSGLKDLISFKKDDFNSFLSNSEPFKEEYSGEWKENNRLVKQMIYETFESNKIHADSTATTTVRIDGLDFLCFGFKLYSPKGEVFLNQLIYSKLINGFLFTAIVNYNNEEDKNILQKALFDSQFRRRR